MYSYLKLPFKKSLNYYNEKTLIKLGKSYLNNAVYSFTITRVAIWYAVKDFFLQIGVNVKITYILEVAYYFLIKQSNLSLHKKEKLQAFFQRYW